MYRRERNIDMEDLHGKLTRIETRMLRGFDALGVNVKATPGWLTVNDEEKTVTINSMHYTLHAIFDELEQQGVHTQGRYALMFQARTLCYL